MLKDIIELYPNPGRKHGLKGLYLGQIPENRRTSNLPFIYSSFISSLDGRIALPGAGRNSHQLPQAIVNTRDLRLFQELAAQADLLITSARYFRQTADQEAQTKLPLGPLEHFDDLRAWRIERGLSPQPDIAVFSASLDIPATALNQYRERNIILITGSASDSKKLEETRSRSHVQVITCGHNVNIDASLLRSKLADRGYWRIFSIAGPSVMNTLVQGNALDRLYLTITHCLLSGTEFDTFVWGPELSPACRMPLRAMYLDTHAPDGTEQTFAIYGQ